MYVVGNDVIVNDEIPDVASDSLHTTTFSLMTIRIFENYRILLMKIEHRILFYYFYYFIIILLLFYLIFYYYEIK